MRMIDKDIRQILEDMEKFFEVEMPSPITYPETFKYYIRIYKYCYDDVSTKQT
jgi:hypothetical protein